MTHQLNGHSINQGLLALSPLTWIHLTVTNHLVYELRKKSQEKEDNERNNGRRNINGGIVRDSCRNYRRMVTACPIPGVATNYRYQAHSQQSLRRDRKLIAALPHAGCYFSKGMVHRASTHFVVHVFSIHDDFRQILVLWTLQNMYWQIWSCAGKIKIGDTHSRCMYVLLWNYIPRHIRAVLVVQWFVYKLSLFDPKYRLYLSLSKYTTTLDRAEKYCVDYTNYLTHSGELYVQRSYMFWQYKLK